MTVFIPQGEVKRLIRGQTVLKKPLHKRVRTEDEHCAEKHVRASVHFLRYFLIRVPFSAPAGYSRRKGADRLPCVTSRLPRHTLTSLHQSDLLFHRRQRVFLSIQFHEDLMGMQPINRQKSHFQDLALLLGCSFPPDAKPEIADCYRKCWNTYIIQEQIWQAQSLEPHQPPHEEEDAD